MLDKKVIRVITASGALPLLICLCLPTQLWFSMQWLLQAYVIVILSFICGIYWCVGIYEQKIFCVILSITLSCYCLVLFYFLVTLTSNLVIWFILLVSVFMMYIIDRFFLNVIIIRQLRFAGTIALTGAIVLIILRLLF